MFELVIFDLDGVLLDSEALYKKSNFALFEELGVTVTHEEYNSFIGISGDKMWSVIKEKGGLKQSIPQLREMEKERKYQILSEEELVPNPGLHELIHEIQEKDIRLCIASSGLMKNIKLILNKLELKQVFEHIVSGEMVERGKPEPDIFLQAAARFEIKPEHCMVIEDSRNGVVAAKAANMSCVGYVNEGSGDQDLSAADQIVEDLTDWRLWAMIHDRTKTDT